jgi:hypothetical protein
MTKLTDAEIDNILKHDDSRKIQVTIDISSPINLKCSLYGPIFQMVDSKSLIPPQPVYRPLFTAQISEARQHKTIVLMIESQYRLPSFKLKSKKVAEMDKLFNSIIDFQKKVENVSVGLIRKSIKFYQGSTLLKAKFVLNQRFLKILDQGKSLIEFSRDENLYCKGSTEEITKLFITGGVSKETIQIRCNSPEDARLIMFAVFIQPPPEAPVEKVTLEAVEVPDIELVEDEAIGYVESKEDTKKNKKVEERKASYG